MSVQVLCAVLNPRAVRQMLAPIDDGEQLCVEFVFSGEEAYRRAMRFAPHVLVTEDVLYDVDGLALVDRLHDELGERMPRVIGISRMPFSAQGFSARGAGDILYAPYDGKALCGVILDQAHMLHDVIDWVQARPLVRGAEDILRDMGMKETLKGFAYLAWAAALACQCETRLDEVTAQLYAPIAARFDTTPQSVERLIRHAVESTMDAIGAKEIYVFFGNTIDPARGKPTNAQILAALVQRMRLM